jgi:16S rRNA (uracil1498-N3)-methyltransferase
MQLLARVGKIFLTSPFSVASRTQWRWKTRVSDRFFTPEPLALGDFILEGPEAHHLTHVRRLGAGDVIKLFNGDGREYRAKVRSVGKNTVHVCVELIDEPQLELGIPLHMAVALPKGDRCDFLIEKLTELGVTDFTPLLATRSVVQPKHTKVEKLRRGVIEASKQCGRNTLMRVHAPCRFEEWTALALLPPNKWIAHPGGIPVADMTEIQGGVAAAIGPEGGFTEEETAAAARFGFQRLGLGTRILRVETAATALVAFVGFTTSRSIREHDG